MIFRSKPTTIEAVHWSDRRGEVLDAALAFAPGKVRWTLVHDLEVLAGKDGAQGWVPVPVGHWLVKNPGDNSDIWPVAPDFFTAKYERAA